MKNALQVVIVGLFLVLVLPVSSFSLASPGQEGPQIRATANQDLAEDPLVWGEIPPDGFEWVEYYELEGGYSGERHHRQDSYQDDGDGIVSVGDFVTLDGIRYPILEVGVVVYGLVVNSQYCPDPEYWGIFEQMSPPVGDFVDLWQLEPRYRSVGTARWWDLNGNGRIDTEDSVEWGACGMNSYLLHIDQIWTQVVLEDFGAVPALPTTWSRMKSMRH